MSLFDNAIQSIQIGLDDYMHDDRLVSSVRNIYAGILLLFKHKLLLLGGEDSSAALIKQVVVPTLNSDGVVIWKGVGNKTIDVATIKSRLTSLGISVDWKIFDRINKHRNEIEHFFSPSTEDEVANLLADCFIIISKFLTDHLNTNAIEVLGEDSWQILLHAYEVFEFEIENTAHTICTLDFHHEIIRDIFTDFCCISCSSPLVKPTQLGIKAERSLFFCAECGSKYSYDDICNAGVPDLCLRNPSSNAKQSIVSFSNCEFCNEGLYIIEHRVCTSCGCN
ncbi:hypothetical protein RZO07_24645 [Pseudomonas protegens]|uniref:hypothetical protein n=1 Tax=Pseudomonas protegens TaxID=380021 RepID=UPI002937074A|nr:hypothetical protein [Pseudomonas protegens]WOE78453.1 hypothetical protein RZO07_24645 [Pseudomonas protegens]